MIEFQKRVEEELGFKLTFRGTIPTGIYVLSELYCEKNLCYSIEDFINFYETERNIDFRSQKQVTCESASKPEGKNHPDSFYDRHLVKENHQGG